MTVVGVERRKIEAGNALPEVHFSLRDHEHTVRPGATHHGDPGGRVQASRVESPGSGAARIDAPHQAGSLERTERSQEYIGRIMRRGERIERQEDLDSPCLVPRPARPLPVQRLNPIALGGPVHRKDRQRRARAELLKSAIPAQRPAVGAAG